MKYNPLNFRSSTAQERARHVFLAVLITLSHGVLLAPSTVKADGAIVINDCQELQQIGNDVEYPLNGDYVLGNDIDCSVTNPDSENFDNTTWDTQGFVPIGNYLDRFTGTFDGTDGDDNFAITGLFINRPNGNDNNIGLFGVIDEGATVTNLDILDVEITGNDDVGALAGGLVGHVENIHATGVVHGAGIVGGLVGQHVPVDNLNNSSPLVFTWNGEKYTYTNDVGSQLPKDLTGLDYARIDSSDMAPKDGKYSMRIAQEYNEIVYYDELALKTYDHAPGYTVVKPLTRGAAEQDVRMVSTNPTNPLVDCEDMYGNNCKNDLQSYDGSWGYVDSSNDQCWTLDFGDLTAQKDTNIQLLMRGARDYSKTPRTKMRSISVKDGSGNWVEQYNKNTLGSDGSPRLRSVDLTGKFLSSDYHVKVCLDTWQMNYFAIDTTAQVPYTEHTYHPETATLGYHGFTQIDDTHYQKHDYDQVVPNPEEMLQTQYGKFTKYGDVNPLLTEQDDHFVVMHYGDEMQVEFPYEAPEAGTERSFILYNDVFYKHANLGALGRTVDPMPYHGMTSFDLNTQYPQTIENLAYLEQWNTREFTGTGRTGGSTVVDSTADVTVDGQWYSIGGLVGFNRKPIINSHAYGDVTGDWRVGGLVGFNGSWDPDYKGDITNSSAHGSVGPKNAYLANAGGLVGQLAGTASVDQSYATGTVTGVDYIGGLVGSMYSTGHIRESYATGSVSGGNNVGGFAGQIIDGEVSDNFSSGNVAAEFTRAGGFVGGIFGGAVSRNYSSAPLVTAGDIDGISGGFGGDIVASSNAITLTDNFAASLVGGGLIGGFAGAYDPNTVESMNNIFDAYAADLTTDNCVQGTTFDGCSGVDSSEASNILKTTGNTPFSVEGNPVWDFTEVWQLPSALNDGYPCLQWQEGCIFSFDLGGISSATDNSALALRLVGCSSIGEWQTLKDSELAVDDKAYEYPQGFVEFVGQGCVNGGSIVVQATFTTDLSPDVVVFRKYSSDSGAYTTLTQANSNITVTQTTLEGKAALLAQYTVVDGGALDQDGIVNGEIWDPVGLGVGVVQAPVTGIGGTF